MSMLVKFLSNPDSLGQFLAFLSIPLPIIDSRFPLNAARF
jgi:hypothetical protein